MSSYDTHLKLLQFARSLRSSFDGLFEFNEELRNGAQQAAKIQKRPAIGSSIDSILKELVKIQTSEGTLANVKIIASATEQMAKLLKENSSTFEKLRNQLFPVKDLTDAIRVACLSQAKLSRFESLRFGELVGIDIAASNSLKENLNSLSRSYKALIDLTSVKSSVIHDYPQITSQVPFEYYREIEVLESLTIEDVDREGEPIPEPDLETIEILLAHLNPDLLDVWRGALGTLNNESNAERVRHFSSSMRELLRAILQRLAPDKEVMQWNSDPTLYHNGSPTRQARLLFIQRHINLEPLTEFIEQDVRSVLALFQALHQGTHRIPPNLTDLQLEFLALRIESLLFFLLQINETRH